MQKMEKSFTGKRKELCLSRALMGTGRDEVG
jgi:hypothetical protein